MRFLFKLIIGIVVLILLCFGFIVFAKTEDRGPGQYSPGFHSTNLTVPHREKPLTLFVWYPTQDSVSAELVGQNALFYGHYVRPKAEPQTGRHPIVVFSHGSGGNAYQIGWLAEALAANGYVVLAANHHGTTSRDSLPERTVMIWERANDLREILNWVETPSIEGLSLDPSKIAVAGFSLGGHSALALSGLQVSKEKFIDYCDRNTGLWDCGWLERGGVNFNEIDAAQYNASYYDERVRATIAIDPALSAAATMDSANRMSHPLLTINFVPNEGVPEALDATEITQAVPSGRHVSIPQSWHFSFLPECSLLGKVAIGIGGEENICSDWKHRDRSEVHQLVIKQIIPFLDDSLN